MCGRFSSFDPESDKGINGLVDEAKALFGKMDTPYKLKTEGDVYPTDVVPILLESDGGKASDNGHGALKLRCEAMYWGYPGYPDRFRPNAKPRPLINAKGETALKLKTWKESTEHRRCVVPTSGFYEWSHHDPKKKTKYLFTVPSEKYLLLGAIYKEIKSPDGVPFPHFSIITVAANDSMIKIHNRMPLILEKKDLPLWFSPKGFEGILEKRDIMLEKTAM
ncbi:MAG: SOS response-associated peptidase [Deltaproteobacteria bacterium]|jgi:putative SOS response-associated peptidase YedK|nr:SOS response-associated peptidase [Deltaproteobacteria bacterium]